MSGYTKLFNKILTSSIWSESSDTRVLWITMLAAADKDGIVLGTPSGLARLAGVTREQCVLSLGIFLGPDCEGSQDYQGRRIVAVEGGYRLLNHGKYRELLTKADQNEKAKVRMRHIRRTREHMRTDANIENTANCYAGVRDVRQASTEASTSTTAEATTTAKAGKSKARARNTNTRLPEDFIPKPEHYVLAKEHGVIVDMEFPRFRDHFLGNGERKLDWNRTLNNWIRRAKEFKPGGQDGRSKRQQGLLEVREQARAAIMGG